MGMGRRVIGSLASIVLAGAISGCTPSTPSESCLKAHDIEEVSIASFTGPSSWGKVSGLDKQIPQMVETALMHYARVKTDSIAAANVSGSYMVRGASSVDMDLFGQKVKIGDPLVRVDIEFRDSDQDIKLREYGEGPESVLSTVVDGAVERLVQMACNEFRAKSGLEPLPNTAVYVTTPEPTPEGTPAIPFVYPPNDLVQKNYIIGLNSGKVISIWDDNETHAIDNLSTTADRLFYDKAGKWLYFIKNSNTSDIHSTVSRIKLNGTGSEEVLDSQAMDRILNDMAIEYSDEHTIISTPVPGSNKTQSIDDFAVGPNGRIMLNLRAIVRGEQHFGIIYSFDPSKRSMDRVIDSSVNRVSLSPDGHRMAYVNDKRDITIVNLSDLSNTRMIANGYDPSWSPDGKYIAYVSRGDLYLVNTSGDPVEKRLTQNQFSEFNGMTWTPDSSAVIFGAKAATQSVYYIKTDGTNLLEFWRGLGSPLVVPKPKQTPK